MIARWAYKDKVAAVFIAAMFMQIMDGTIINVALPTLADEFGVQAPEMDWTVLSFTIALGVMTASAGWFGDRFGLRKVFLIALGGFIVTSALCGSAQSLDQLVASRALQGASAGLITPIGSSLLFSAFPLSERSVASRKVVTVAVIAPALGPIVGGAILEVTSWRWIFLVNVPIGLTALVLAAIWLRTDDPEPTGAFDISGFVLLCAGIGLGMYGISRGGERGWSSPAILLSLGSSVLLLAMLVRVELRKATPLLQFRLLRERMFRTCNVLSLPTYAGFMSLIYVLPLFLQDEAGHSPLEVGLAMFPQPVGVLVTSQIVGRYLYKRVGPRRLMLAGAVLAGVISAGIGLIDTDTNLHVVRVAMFARGAAMGLFFVPIQAAVYARIEPQVMTRATAIYGTSRQVAPALGVAISSTVLAASGGTSVLASERLGGYQAAMFAGAAMFAVAAVITLWIRDEDAAATMVD